MEFRKVNITLPVQLFEKSKELVDKGLYSNFSDLVRSSLRKELKEDQELLKGHESILEKDRGRAVMFAAMNGHLGVVQELLKGNASISEEDRNQAKILASGPDKGKIIMILDLW